MRTTHTRLAVLAGLAATAVVAGCSSGSGASGDAAGPSSASGGKVSISVVSLIPGSEKAAFKAFDDQVAIFEQKNPTIDVKPREYQWTGPTFAAQLAGG